MDIDRYIASKAEQWHRMMTLTNKANGRASRLSHEELNELVALYQRTSGHLAHVRTRYRDPALIEQLSGNLSDSRQIIYSRRRGSSSSVLAFFAFTLPGALWTIRRWILGFGAVFLVVSVVSGLFMYFERDALDAEIPPALQAQIANHDFEDYYSSAPAQDFAAQVQINNIVVSILAFAGGAAFGIFPIAVILREAVRFGQMGALMHRAGGGGKFWGLILPHGLLELTSICVACAAGAYMAYGWLAPGRKSRAEGFAASANTAMTVAGGLVMNFVIAGFIEAFVTPSTMPTAVRIGIGFGALALFLTYMIVLGPPAVAAGHTGVRPKQPNTWERQGAALDATVAIETTGEEQRRRDLVTSAAAASRTPLEPPVSPPSVGPG